MYKVSSSTRPESVFSSLNFICDSNLWKLISFFRGTRINLYLINLLVFFLLLPFHRRFECEETQKLCINILPDSHRSFISIWDVFVKRDEAWRRGKSEIKLPMKIHTNRQKKKKRQKNRRHFLNIKTMRDCWSKKNGKNIFYNTHRYVMIIVVVSPFLGSASNIFHLPQQFLNPFHLISSEIRMTSAL